MSDSSEIDDHDQSTLPESQNIVILHGPDGSTWYVVAEVAGVTNAEIVAGLLRSARIPVYLYREAAGSSALPLTVGLLGSVTVAVPEIYYAEALALLDADSDQDGDTSLDELEDGQLSEDDDPSEDDQPGGL